MRPQERIALLFCAAIAALFAIRGWPFVVGELVLAYLTFMGSITAFVLLAWLPVTIGRRLRRRRTWREAGLDLVELGRGLVVLLVVLVAYTNLKTYLVRFNPRLYDRWLERLDAWIHFAGGDFQGWIVSFTDRQALTALFEPVYFNAWLSLALPLAVGFARHGGRVVRRALAALALAYVVGGFLNLAFPSLGPAFVARSRFAALAPTYTFAVQGSMLRVLRMAMEHPEVGASPFFGIAAFPSLHVATTWLGVLIAARHCRPLRYPLVAANLLIAASTAYLGWHYLLDAWAGIGLAVFGWYAAGRFEPPEAEAAEHSSDSVAPTEPTAVPSASPT